jgi:hypothetical protein
MTKYFLLKDKKILRIDEEEDTQENYQLFKPFLLVEGITPINQDQANYRVALFRDTIMNLNEWKQSLNQEQTIQP